MENRLRIEFLAGYFEGMYDMAFCPCNWSKDKLNKFVAKIAEVMTKEEFDRLKLFAEDEHGFPAEGSFPSRGLCTEPEAWRKKIEEVISSDKKGGD